MSSNFDSTPSTESPSDSSKLPPAIAIRIPPELLLDIFSIVSDSSTKHYDQYLDRNRNLKSFALVHSTWRYRAKEVLQEEVHMAGRSWNAATVEEIENLLIKCKVQRTKYLTFDGHLNELIAKTGNSMWSQVRYLKLWGSSRNDGTTHMSDLARFARLQELHLNDYTGHRNFLCFDPSDVNLQFSHLRRITISWDVTIGVLSQSGDIKRARQEDLAALIPITHKLFSPSNMPNLLHLALDGSSDTLPTYMILLAEVLPQITTLAIWCYDFDIVNLFPKNRILDNVRHLSLIIHDKKLSDLFGHGRWNLQSLHLSSRSVAGEKLVITRLIKIAKGEDPKNRIDRIVIYGKRKGIETKYKDLVNDLDSFDWREDQDPSFADFDGR